MIRLALAAEDELGCAAVRHVTDLIALKVEWIERENLDVFRSWHDFEGADWLPLKQVSERCRNRFGANFRVAGHFGGQPGEADALSIRKLLAYLAEEDPLPAIVVVARDTDHSERRDGFAQAKHARTWPFEVVGAHAIPEVEAWLICTWTPAGESDEERRAELRHLLGFDPVTRSHELTSTSPSKKDAKATLARLEAGGRSARHCFENSPLEELEQHGSHNGLTTFIGDLRTTLVPRLDPRR